MDLNTQLAIKKLEWQVRNNDANVCQWEQRLLELEIDQGKIQQSIGQAKEQNQELMNQIKKLGG